MKKRVYMAIDLKSFYASVECRERGLNPMTTNLVVADEGRSEKTICLAVSPSLKSLGLSGRPRLFEVEQKVQEANAIRKQRACRSRLTQASSDALELRSSPELAVSYIVATPRMAYYLKYSTRIYEVYLKYIAPEDIHVYSIDEVFIDVTDYLTLYHMTAHELARTIIHDVLKTTGITATAGIGPNLYLCKVAMDIVAKKMPPDAFGVRIAELDEISYRALLWHHRPLTSFWRVGKGYAAKLETHGMYTMGDVARMSLTERGEQLLYHLFGVNAELLIDHAWGVESCTMADIKAYEPKHHSISSSQILPSGYPINKARLVVREMVESLVFELLEKGLVTPSVGLTISYDSTRGVSKSSRGTKKLVSYTSSTRLLKQAVTTLFDEIVDQRQRVRRVSIVFSEVRNAQEIKDTPVVQQLDLFTNLHALQQKEQEQEADRRKERRQQEAMLQIREKFGKNAILKGMNLKEGATGRDRNNQIGGHRA